MIRRTWVGVAALLVLTAAPAIAESQTPGANNIYSREWIGRQYGSPEGLPRVSAAFDSLPGSHSVYGQIRISTSYDYTNSGPASNGGKKRHSLGQDDEASVFGVRGWVGDDDLKGLYSAQFGINFDGASSSDALSRRWAWIGLQHKRYGQLVVGRTNTTYKIVGPRFDPFFDSPAGNGHGDPSFGLSRFNGAFVNNTVEYTTPTMSGFKANGAIFIDDSSTDDHGYNAGVEYGTDSLTMGAQYLHASVGSGLNTGKDVDALRGFVRYAGDGFTILASYEHEFDKGQDETDYAYLAGTMDATESMTVALAGGFQSDGLTKGWGGSAGAFYELFDGVFLYGLVSHVEIDDKVPGVAAQTTRTVASLGVNLAFGIGDK